MLSNDFVAFQRDMTTKRREDEEWTLNWQADAHS